VHVSSKRKCDAYYSPILQLREEKLAAGIAPGENPFYTIKKLV
jgi:hypothetical protein